MTTMKSDVEDLGSVVISHHGVKGQKWGVRRVRVPSSRVEARKGGTTHPDRAEVNTHLNTAKTHGTAALSNADLKKLNNRLNLEKQFSDLTTSNAQKSKVQKGHEFIKKGVDMGRTITSIHQISTSPAAKAAIKLIK